MSEPTAAAHAPRRVAPILLTATLVLLAIAESHGLAITTVKASWYDGIPWSASLGAQWPQRLVLPPLILAAAAVGARSRPLAVVAAAAALAWAAACLVVPIELPHQSYPWMRLDSYAWDRQPSDVLSEHRDPVLPGAIGPVRAAGVALGGLGAALVATVPARRWSAFVGAALVVAAVATLAASMLPVELPWLDGPHSLLVVVGVLCLAGRRPVLGTMLLGVVGACVTLAVAWDGVWMRSATEWDTTALVAATGLAYLAAVVVAIVGCAQRPAAASTQARD